MQSSVNTTRVSWLFSYFCTMSPLIRELESVFRKAEAVLVLSCKSRALIGLESNFGWYIQRKSNPFSF